MHPHENRFLRIDAAHHQHQVLGVIDLVAIDDCFEIAILRWQLRLCDAVYHRFVPQPVLDEIGNGYDS